MEGLLVEMEALSGDLFSAEEAREGMTAFAERRATAWSLAGASS
jgi:hypothetical protein